MTRPDQARQVKVLVPSTYLDQFKKKMFCQKTCLFNVNRSRLLPRNLSSVRTFVSFYYGSGSGSGTVTGAVINYGSGSATVKSYAFR
jgi:hypothetical protein